MDILPKLSLPFTLPESSTKFQWETRPDPSSKAGEDKHSFWVDYSPDDHDYFEIHRVPWDQKSYRVSVMYLQDDADGCSPVSRTTHLASTTSLEAGKLLCELLAAMRFADWERSQTLGPLTRDEIKTEFATQGYGSQRIKNRRDCPNCGGVSDTCPTCFDFRGDPMG